jgi:diaminopropionate ammonia-lyase
LIAAPLFARSIKIIVEPENAACLLQSAKLCCRSVIKGTLKTNMAGLACGEPSTVAWQRLCDHDVHFLSISDAAACAAIDLLRSSQALGATSSVGPSGAAGFAGFLSALKSNGLKEQLGLNEGSSVAVVGTESAVPAAAQQSGV